MVARRSTSSAQRNCSRAAARPRSRDRVARELGRVGDDRRGGERIELALLDDVPHAPTHRDDVVIAVDPQGVGDADVHHRSRRAAAIVLFAARKRRTCAVALWLGVAFHVITFFTLEVGHFALYSLAFYAVFVPWERVTRSRLL